MVSGDHDHDHDHFNETDSDTADQLLTSLGYKPELLRTRSTFQVAFMSFVLASVPYGLATTLYYPLVCGGPVDIIWGWVAVSLIIVCVAASLGEITSVYPTAGGVYYQAFMLAPLSYRRLSAWITGWLYVVGNITITLSVNFATALFLVASVNVFETAEGEAVLAGEAYQVFLIFLGVTLLCNITFAIFWTFAGVVAILITVLVVAKNGRNDASYVFGNFEVNSGWTPGWSFFVGLLHAAYATSSTGMILSMCEEVRAPATQVPKAMVLTILFNLAAGLITLIPLVFVMDDIQYLITLAQPVPAIIKSAVGNSGGAFALLIPLLVLGIICGIGCTTATSRSIYGFARDGAIPGSKWWKVVHPKLDVPLNGMMLSMVIQIALGLIYFGSTAAFNAFSGVGVIALTAAYSAPIFVSMLEGRKTVSTGSFFLGKIGWACNIVSISWTLLVIPLFSMPTTVPIVDPSLVNYAPVVFVGFTLISLGWYIAWGRKNYVGPPT
ncbi:hypothetical protein GQX73_g5874 [Xylaria multiplex]|uniref:Amino acid permease/ SLC12A domain-containing protein n=1 Tax=Xylaria multiplex TaxID=323545 RepID=A0A7C8N6D7_9PEZI|nr:hypothetical protein GQX73_g5874 [Xylaria multiplex]